MNKYTLLIIVLAFYNSTALGQVYELEQQGQSGQYHSPSELYEFGFLDFNNNEQPDLILVTYHNDDSRTVTVLDENYSEIWSYTYGNNQTEEIGFVNFTGNSTKEFVYHQWVENGQDTLCIVNTVTYEKSNVLIPDFDYAQAWDFDSDLLEEIIFSAYTNGEYSPQIWGYNSTAQTSSDNYPDDFQINQNYPNPFNPSTSIEYKLKREGSVKIQIFNIKGQLVETLDDSFKTPGSYSLKWHPNGLGSGQYYYQIILDGKPVKTKKAIYLK